jgi:hypothetical protein
LFDPTIFDNLKVVIEGAVYDKDLDGLWYVVNRKDNVDLATMSRDYSISFQLKKNSSSSCRWLLSSTVTQLASELTGQKDQSTQGCSTSLEFTVLFEEGKRELESVYDTISTIWGDRELVSTVVDSYPKVSHSKMIVSIEFNRIIYEEDIDDLLTMLTYMEKTLYELHQKGY